MRRRSDEGQILVIFAFSMVVLLLLAGLVFDAAQAYARRRQLQDTGDAAALAAANVLQAGSPIGCSAVGDGGTPRTLVSDAAKAMVEANLPGFPVEDITIRCVAGTENTTLEVTLADHTPGFFGALAGIDGFDVATSSQAVNGLVAGNRYSIVELDPSHTSWPNGRQGCPSVLISGGPTVILEGSMMINSACPSAKGGGLGTNGNAASIQLLNSSTIRMVGPYVPSTLTISPAPVAGQPALRDPFLGITPVDLTGLPVRSASRLTLSNADTVLQPGVYTGGILMKNSARAFLKPGLYVMNGGGFQIGAQNAVYSIPASKSSTSEVAWAGDCTASTCGVLIYNTGMKTSSDAISVGAGAILRLRPYKAAIDGSGLARKEYDNLLLWQNGSPVPSSTYAQPEVSLNGGGTVEISGTVYTPSAMVKLGGGSGGTGGATELTLQFVSWNLELRGNSSFRFRFRADAFARPVDYGLVK